MKTNIKTVVPASSCHCPLKTMYLQTCCNMSAGSSEMTLHADEVLESFMSFTRGKLESFRVFGENCRLGGVWFSEDGGGAEAALLYALFVVK